MYSLPVLTGILCCDSGDERTRYSLIRIAEPDNANSFGKAALSKPEGQPWSRAGKICGLGGFFCPNTVDCQGCIEESHFLGVE